MDIYDYLKLDHKLVSHLFKQFETSKIIVRKQQILDMIIQELIKHAVAEQDVFYKALEQYEQSHDIALHGLKEHQEIIDQINSITRAKSFGHAWEESVEKLKKCVEHHVSEEEGTLFKKAQGVLSEEEAYILKEKMHYYKPSVQINEILQ